METYGGNYNVLNAGSRLATKLMDRQVSVCIGVLPRIDPLSKTGADDFIVARGVSAFKEWVEKLADSERDGHKSGHIGK